MSQLNKDQNINKYKVKKIKSYESKIQTAYKRNNSITFIIAGSKYILI